MMKRQQNQLDVILLIYQIYELQFLAHVMKILIFFMTALYQWQISL